MCEAADRAELVAEVWRSVAAGRARLLVGVVVVRVNK